MKEERIITLKIKLLIFMNVVIPIIIGSGIYALSDDNYIHNHLCEFFGIDRYELIFEFPVFVRNYSCDILWGYSLIFALLIAARYHKGSLKKNLVIAIVFAVLIELSQMFSRNLTFDVMDIIVEVIAMLLAHILIIRIIKNTRG